MVCVIPAEKVFDVTEEQVSYAVRIINVPESAKGTYISARPYFIYKDGGEEMVVYGPVSTESYNSIDGRVNYTDSAKWELYWNDEFGGDTLDETKWTAEVKMENGDVLPYYTVEENVQVKDGSLVLTARKENIGSCNYSSGYVSTSHKFSFLYGRLEFRAKLPYGKGLWPALWTMGNYNVGNGWPNGGEIDLLELIGEDNTDPAAESNRIATHNLHWGTSDDDHFSVGGYNLDKYNNRYTFPVDTLPSADYHIYAIEWAEREITFFVDDVMLYRVKWGTDSDGDYLEWYNANGTRVDKVRKIKNKTIDCDQLDFAFSNASNFHYLIMNVGLCEGWDDMANQADGGNLPQSMYVDYVRVYKAAE